MAGQILDPAQIARTAYAKQSAWLLVGRDHLEILVLIRLHHDCLTGSELLVPALPRDATTDRALARVKEPPAVGPGGNPSVSASRLVVSGHPRLRGSWPPLGLVWCAQPSERIVAGRRSRGDSFSMRRCACPNGAQANESIRPPGLPSHRHPFLTRHRGASAAGRLGSCHE